MGPILLVEDDASTRVLISSVLSREGYQVVTAEHGQEAFHCLRRHRPCLVLLDLGLPVMDGLRFLKQYKKVRDPDLAAVPVVLLTSHVEAERLGYEYGAREALAKPVDPRVLIERIRAILAPAAETTVRSN